MTIWAIADLHLSFGVPDKKMDIFGAEWVDHPSRIAESWKKHISNDDLVLIAGDISWAMRLEDALIDLRWIDQLPGTKVIIKGNHDYWWHSLSKVRSQLPQSCHVIQNDAFDFGDVSVAGARLWDTAEYSFGEGGEADEKIFERELQRLEMSLKALSPTARLRIAMTHYPPISVTLAPSKASALLEKYRVDLCVFGHLHGVKDIPTFFGEKEGVRYYLTACDALKFAPLKLATV